MKTNNFLTITILFVCSLFSISCEQEDVFQDDSAFVDGPVSKASNEIPVFPAEVMLPASSLHNSSGDFQFEAQLIDNTIFFDLIVPPTAVADVTSRRLSPFLRSGDGLTINGVSLTMQTSYGFVHRYNVVWDSRTTNNDGSMTIRYRVKFVRSTFQFLPRDVVIESFKADVHFNVTARRSRPAGGISGNSSLYLVRQKDISFTKK